MSAKHTPGKLKTRKGFHEETIEIFKPNPKLKKPFYPTEIATVNADDDKGKANARRLVACWNACEGISTDALQTEGSAVMGWMRAASKLLHTTTQRDELLAALKDFHNWADNQADAQSKGCHATFDLLMLREQRDIARAAIAKAEGGTA